MDLRRLQPALLLGGAGQEQTSNQCGKSGESLIHFAGDSSAASCASPNMSRAALTLAGSYRDDIALLLSHANRRLRAIRSPSCISRGRVEEGEGGGGGRNNMNSLAGKYVGK